MNNEFCIFILSHGRPDKIHTLKTLQKGKYTGDYFIIIDDEDSTSDLYYEKYGDKVIQFNKLKISKTFDTCDNFNNRKTIVYARNACFEIAKKLGYKYFMQLDDDYTRLSYRVNKKGEFKETNIKNLDKLFYILLDFYKSTRIDCLAFAQGGDFIGGKENDLAKNIKTKRKAMNTLLCSTDREFKFIGRINEDVNTYVRLGSLGKLFLTISFISINQKTTQTNSGGMTDVYLDSGTYLKSFYTVMLSPASVKLMLMGNKNLRIHHKINWNRTVPCLIDEKYKKV